MLNNPDVARWLGGSRSLDSIRSSIDKSRRHWLRHGWGTWVFHRPDAQRLIGRAGLAATEVKGQLEVEVLWTTMPDVWGCGVATEMGRVAVSHACEHLNVASLVAFTLHDNLASRRVMEKLGFAYEDEFMHADLPHVLYRLPLASA